MKQFNLVATLADGGRFPALLRELAAFGEFHKTEFFGVVLGQVAEPLELFEAIGAARDESPQAFADLGRLIPVSEVFHFTVDSLVEEASRAIRPHLAQFAGKSFYVRLERRGFKGKIISPEAERQLDAVILEASAASGQPARVDFTDPDLIVALETFGGRAGIGWLGRELRARFPFVRVG